MNARIAISTIMIFICAVSMAQQAQQARAETHKVAAKSPIIQSDGRVTFNLHAPAASAVTVSGDYPIGKNVALVKGDEGDWNVTLGPLREDIYAYRFEVDGVPTLDPENVYVTRDGTQYENWAPVPGPDTSNYMINDVPHGRTLSLWYPLPTLKLTRRLIVYTPPDYDNGSTRYPVLYLLNGGGGDEEEWSNMGRAPEILDNLIAQQKAVPMIVVMANGHYWQTASPNQVTNPLNSFEMPVDLSKQRDIHSDMITRYADSIVPDLVPFVDKTFRTKADRDDRAIAGLSMGGAQTIHAAFNNLQTFSWVALLSSAAPLLPGVGKVIPRPADSAQRRGPGLGQTIDLEKFAEAYPAINPDLNKRLHLLYLGVGKVDGLLESEQDLQTIFEQHGVKFVKRDLDDYGHDWNFWRMALEDFSTRLFKTANWQASQN